MFTRNLLLPLFLATCGLPAAAQVYSPDAVKAAFVFRFASYVEWPEDAPRDAPFVIAVAGASDVADQLAKLLPGLTVHGRRAELRRVTRVAELDGAHILYIGQEVVGRTRPLREAAKSRPILLVTDQDADGLDGGGVINFIQVSRNVRFEISLVAAERSRLKINSALLSVAANVIRRPQAGAYCDPYKIHHRPHACAIRVALQVPSNSSWYF